MSRYPDITPELLKRILPALRMLVRFPAMPAQEASTKTSIELNEIYAYTMRRGRPKETDLEVIESEIDEGVAPKPAKLTRQAAKATPAPAAKPAAAPAPAKAETPAVAATPDANFGGHRFVSTAFRKYRPVVEMILAEPSISQLEACRRNKVEQSTWCSYKTNFFGLGDMKAEKMRAFLTWGDAQLQLRTGVEADASAPPPKATERPVARPPQSPRHSARNQPSPGLRLTSPKPPTESKTDAPKATNHMLLALGALTRAASALTEAAVHISEEVKSR